MPISETREFFILLYRKTPQVQTPLSDAPDTRTLPGKPQLFSYDNKQRCPIMDLGRRIKNPQVEQHGGLIKEYDLRSLDKHNENINRFLTFIGKPRQPKR